MDTGPFYTRAPGSSCTTWRLYAWLATHKAMECRKTVTTVFKVGCSNHRFIPRLQLFLSILRCISGTVHSREDLSQTVTLERDHTGRHTHIHWTINPSLMSLVKRTTHATLCLLLHRMTEHNTVPLDASLPLQMVSIERLKPPSPCITKQTRTRDIRNQRHKGSETSGTRDIMDQRHQGSETT